MTENLSTVENAKEKLDLWLKQGLTAAGGKLPSERAWRTAGDQTHDAASGAAQPGSGIEDLS